MIPVIYGHVNLDKLLAAAGLRAAAAAAPITNWPPVLRLLARHWIHYLHAIGGRIELASPTADPLTSPRFWLRSDIIPARTFADLAADTVAVLGELVATDPLRGRYAGDDDPGPKIEIQCGAETPVGIQPAPDAPENWQKGRWVQMQTRRAYPWNPHRVDAEDVRALVRITLPSAVSEGRWPDDIEAFGLDSMTSIDHSRMIRTVQDWWLSQGIQSDKP